MNTSLPVFSDLHIASTSNGDYVASAVKWTGGKGWFVIGSSITASHNVQLTIDWAAGSVNPFFPFTGSNATLSFGSNVVNVTPVQANELYEFEAPAGYLRVGLSFAASDNVSIGNCYIFT